MKHIFGLFSCFLCMSSVVIGANGTGAVEFLAPVAVQHTQNVNFGTVAIDPTAGTQTVTRSVTTGSRVCPAAYVCTGTSQNGLFTITGYPSASISLSVVGQLATLSDGAGHTLTFDPTFYDEVDSTTRVLDASGVKVFSVGGSITFTGNEVAGTYSSQNSGGSGYTITVNY
ncbi:MAG: DUF4402 domain-containing protein [Alphaproteobacteria bacterium]|nr:DUF4402 domain-containing protein [Alphaproteobacteria bacterium]MBN2780180.1 DUF4402 domain-containing protein [Alphaproteobacteria bacterium]